MALEIERKFLVRGKDYRRLAASAVDMVQGYLSTSPYATVRVRIAGNKAFITVKSRTKGATRGEWEYRVPVEDARQMLSLCRGVVSKTRYLVPAPPYAWEVDEFGGHLQGLTVAEIELPAENAPFALPHYIGREVTGDPRYYNSSLSETTTLPPTD